MSADEPPVVPRRPRPSDPPGPMPPGGEPVEFAGGPVGPRDPRVAWWQNEVAIIAVGIVMLALGGVLGYVLGHDNVRVRTRAIVVQRPARTETTPTTSLSTTTTTATTTGPAKTHTTTVAASTTAKTRTTVTKTVGATRTVTATKTRTASVPAHTVTVRSPAHTVTVRTTTTVTATKTTGTATTASQSGGSGSQTFTGANSQNLGTLNVPAASLLRWTCSGCASTSFTITNSTTDPTALGVQAQMAASGQTTIAAGTYTNVTVQGTGSWSFTIAPQG